MGSYVSVVNCRDNLGVSVNCDKPTRENGGIKMGGFDRGNFPPDPDIAGVGIVAAFIAVTGFALLISTADVFWLLAKHFGVKKRRSRADPPGRISASDILETLVMSCSDQQVFTGVAYVVSLRYYKGCQISAYHYNIVANLMLLTCATHLMSVTIVRNYWRFFWLALLRILVVTGVFLATGLLLSNQNTTIETGFPTNVPPRDFEIEGNLVIMLPAACFQADTHLEDALNDSLDSGKSFKDAVVASRTSANTIHGWNNYLVILLWYGVAIIAEIVRFIRRGRDHPGWRSTVAAKVSQTFSFARTSRVPVAAISGLYLVGGIAISTWTVVISAKYIVELRRWVEDSGWIAGKNPENDPTSFGQLVPIFLTTLTLFSFLQVISEKMAARRGRRLDSDDEPPRYTDAGADGGSGSEKKGGVVVSEKSVPQSTVDVTESNVPESTTKASETGDRIQPATRQASETSVLTKSKRTSSVPSRVSSSKVKQ